MYDIIILGGGISGFYCALELIKHNIKICICEKYKILGGRVSTFNQDGYTWEMGAGRISKDHLMVLDLMKKYNQPVVQIDSNINFLDKCLENNIFEDLIRTHIYPLENLDKNLLATHTLRELCEKIYGKEQTDNFLIRFPYRAEVDVLRADLGIESFKKEMGSHQGYFVAKNGLSNLIEEMKKDFLSKKGEIFTNYQCINIENKKDYIECEFKNQNILQGKKVICAMESEALKKINFFKNFSTLRYLKMEPLLRTYAVYPTGWFSQYTRIVTPNPIRYFLPISYEKHIAMVSYTDSSDTNKFYHILTKYKEESLGKHIQNELRKLFGPIPNYTYFKAHYWHYGATYWLPGKYDYVEESKKSLKPFDSEVYVVGESFSLKQAWLEGSLLQCKKLLDTYSI
jgi:hypothetical protein